MRLFDFFYSKEKREARRRARQIYDLERAAILTRGKTGYEQVIDSLLELDPNNGDVVWKKIYILCRENKTHEATALVEKSISLFAGEDWRVYELMEIYDAYMNPDQNFALFELLKQTYPWDAQLINYRKACCMVEQKMYQDAIPVFEDLKMEYELESEAPTMHHLLAMCYNQINDTTACLNQLEEVLRLKPSMKKYIKEDPDFLNLKDNEEFRLLME